MYFAQLSLAATIALATTGMALAQQTTQLNDLDAERINPTQITVDFEYTGNTCDQVGPAVVGEGVGGTLSVTFPTVSTAEVCTTQAVPIEVEQTIEAGTGVFQLEITLTAPDGSIIATGTVLVENN